MRSCSTPSIKRGMMRYARVIMLQWYLAVVLEQEKLAVEKKRHGENIGKGTEQW